MFLLNCPWQLFHNQYSYPNKYTQPQKHQHHHWSASMDSLDYLTICPYGQSLLADTLDGTQCLHRADKCKSMLIGQHLCVCVWESTERLCLWVCPCFSSSAQHVLFVWHGWFVRWEASVSKAAVLWGAASRIRLKQYFAFLCSSHLAFSSCVY